MSSTALALKNMKTCHASTKQRDESDATRDGIAVAEPRNHELEDVVSRLHGNLGRALPLTF